jgi:hypothetical protein
MVAIPVDWWVVATALQLIRFVYSALATPDDAVDRLDEVSQDPGLVDNPLLGLLLRSPGPLSSPGLTLFVTVLRVLRTVLSFYAEFREMIDPFLSEVADLVAARFQWVGVGVLAFVLLGALLNYRVFTLLPAVTYPSQLDEVFGVVVLLLAGSMAAGTRRAVSGQLLVVYAAVVGIVVLSLPLLLYLAYPLVYLLLGGLAFLGVVLFQEVTDGRYDGHLFAVDLALALAAGGFTFDYIRRGFLLTENVFLLPLGLGVVVGLGVLALSTKRELEERRRRHTVR